MNAKNKTATAGQAAALPKARKSVTNIDVLHLKSVVELCAFASEARRILEGIDYAAKVRPEVGDGIRAYVHAPSNWTSFECPVAEVLSEVAHTLDRLCDDICKAEQAK